MCDLSRPSDPCTQGDPLKNSDPPRSAPADCQRCSEVLRDHIMRQKPNSAKCSRDEPCDDCNKVLAHFDLSGELLWSKFDERAKHNRLKRSRNSIDSASAPPRGKPPPPSPHVAVGGKRERTALMLRNLSCAAKRGGSEPREPPPPQLARAPASIPGADGSTAYGADHPQRNTEFVRSQPQTVQGLFVQQS